MSELRVALVAEGPTDAIIIEAALKALLSRAFVLTLLQPEETRPKLGAGWGGVLRWCRQFAAGGYTRVEDDPALAGFDLFILHVDADVAECAYEDVSVEAAESAREHGWPPLPCGLPCPPVEDSVEAMRDRLLAWASIQTLGPKSVLCVPSKAIDAWLVSAVFGEGHALLIGLECNLNLEARLRALPKTERVKKTRRGYRAHEKAITERWDAARSRCSQAERFSNEVLAVPLSPPCQTEGAI